MRNAVRASSTIIPRLVFAQQQPPPGGTGGFTVTSCDLGIETVVSEGCQPTADLSSSSSSSSSAVSLVAPSSSSSAAINATLHLKNYRSHGMYYTATVFEDDDCSRPVIIMDSTAMMTTTTTTTTTREKERKGAAGGEINSNDLSNGGTGDHNKRVRNRTLMVYGVCGKLSMGRWLGESYHVGRSYYVGSQPPAAPSYAATPGTATASSSAAVPSSSSAKTSASAASRLGGRAAVVESHKTHYAVECLQDGTVNVFFACDADGSHCEESILALPVSGGGYDVKTTVLSDSEKQKGQRENDRPRRGGGGVGGCPPGVATCCFDASLFGLPHRWLRFTQEWQSTATVYKIQRFERSAEEKAKEKEALRSSWSRSRSGKKPIDEYLRCEGPPVEHGVFPLLSNISEEHCVWLPFLGQGVASMRRRAIRNTVVRDEL